MPYKNRGIRGQWTDYSMKQAVNAVIVNGLSNKKLASQQYSVPLETLRRKVIVARNGGGVEKNMGRPTVLK